MNLITEPWIPITWRAGDGGLVTLEEAFARGGDIRDLVAKPHERIALLRLLICVAQAALDGPADRSAWEECRDGIPERARDYLRRWKDSFELFGERSRFLQVPNLSSGKEDGEGNPATKLDLTLATGNNATIFDNSGGSERPRTPAELALALLSFQCFSPCGIIGAVRWAKKTIPKCTGRHAPCSASCMLHAYLQRQNRLNTIHANLLDRETVADNYAEGWGKPLWEMMVANTTQKDAIENATLTYLGRLVPLSRLVQLQMDGASIILGNGLEYPTFPVFREAATTIVLRDDEPKTLSTTLERSFWRQLPAITVKRHADKNRLSGPLSLINHESADGGRIWLGAFITAGNGKIEDSVEAAYNLPPGMFQDTGRQVYEAGVALADGWEKTTGRSVKTYAGVLKLQPPPYEKARGHFWTAVEQSVPALLDLTECPALAANLAATPWERAVRAAAENAYEFACPRRTPRQIEAFAKGRQQFFQQRASAKQGEENPSQTVKTRKERKP